MVVNIVVLGAGVSGLTSALLLSRDARNSVTIIAKHMPGDYDIEYTSPWAGAAFQPLSKESESRWERRTWPELSRLAASVPEAGIHFQRTRVYRRPQELNNGASAFDSMFCPNPWYSRLFPDFRELEGHELPVGVQTGSEFTGLCINTALYLPWLVGQCRKQGVVLKRGTVSDVRELKELHHTGSRVDIVVNASGLQARRLGGVMDVSVVPIRGQIVVVENEAEPIINVSGTDDGAEEVTYLMTRAAGGGTVLGGTYEKGKWDPEPDIKTSERIIRRCVAINPNLAKGKGIEGITVVRHGVGLRPWREQGVRVESDLATFTDGTLLVHNYGHAGWGYQGSYGCAEYVVELVNGFLKRDGEDGVTISARL